MTIQPSLRSLRSTSADIGASASTLRSVDRFINGTSNSSNRDTPSPGDNFVAYFNAAGPTAIGLAGAKVVLELSSNALDNKIGGLKRDKQQDIKRFNREVAAVEEAADSGELVTLIGGVSPGVGPVIRRLDLNKALGRIGVSAEQPEAQGVKIDRSIQTTINRLETLKKVVDTASDIITVAETAIVITGGLTLTAGEARDDIISDLGATSASIQPLANDGRAEAGFAAYSSASAG
ncbi:MAG: hypothetical protein WD969_09550 [Paracoccaceae bacterium]